METLNNQTKTAIIDIINAMDQSDLIQLNNEYCQAINAMDSEIFSNDQDFLETFFSNNLDGLARSICYGDYNYSHDFVRFDGYGNLESFNWFETKDLCELVPTMAEYIAENPREFTQFDEIDFN